MVGYEFVITVPTACVSEGKVEEVKKHECCTEAQYWGALIFNYMYTTVMQLHTNASHISQFKEADCCDISWALSCSTEEGEQQLHYKSLSGRFHDFDSRATVTLLSALYANENVQYWLTWMDNSMVWLHVTLDSSLSPLS